MTQFHHQPKKKKKTIQFLSHLLSLLFSLSLRWDFHQTPRLQQWWCHQWRFWLWFCCWIQPFPMPPSTIPHPSGATEPWRTVWSAASTPIPSFWWRYTPAGCCWTMTYFKLPKPTTLTKNRFRAVIGRLAMTAVSARKKVSRCRKIANPEIAPIPVLLYRIEWEVRYHCCVDYILEVECWRKTNLFMYPPFWSLIIKWLLFCV